jgi:parvulin-like peptidyl-prolyl isomerase
MSVCGMAIMKNLIVSTVAALFVMCLCGCGETETDKPDVDEARLTAVKSPTSQPKMPEPAGGIVLSIESTAITADELIAPVKPQLDELAAQYNYEQFNKRAKPLLANVLIQKITDIKLYEKAKAALPENIDQTIIDRIVEQEVQRFIAHYGGNYATAEQMLKKMGTNWHDFHQQQRRAVLVQSFLSDEIKVEKPITHSELVQYYESIKDEDFAKDALIEFRLIDVNIERFADANDPNINAGQKAIELARQLAGRIKNGEDFAELAKKYSHDETAQNGGLWKPVRPGSLVEPYNAIETAAENMDVGGVSEPITAGSHIFIVKLENKQAQSCEPFEKVQTEVEARYVLERRQKMVNDMINKIISQVDLSYANNFLEFCIEQAWRQAGK